MAEPCIGTRASDCATDAWFLRDSGGAVDYRIPIAIIEFDDQGALMRRAYKDRIMDQLREIASDNDVLFAVFAHGWLNNASADNGNLRDFQTMLVRLAAADQQLCRGQRCEGRKVVGIYLGWRGLSATWQPARLLSFWNRKKRAHRVGQDGAAEVIGELKKIRNQRRDGQRPASRLVLVGHSFGGALIYTAVQQILQRDLSFPNQGSISRSVADMVVLVNPAFEAARVNAIREKSADMTFSRTQRPILTIFTSESDTATSRAFPLGRFFSTFFTKYNDERPDQKAQDRTAAGHFKPHLTHTLSTDSELPVARDLTFSVCAWADFQSGSSDRWTIGNGTVLERRAMLLRDGQRNNPYYNVRVTDDIISGHSNIWGDRFSDFLYRFVAVQNAGTCRSG